MPHLLQCIDISLSMSMSLSSCASAYMLWRWGYGGQWGEMGGSVGENKPRLDRGSFHDTLAGLVPTLVVVLVALIIVGFITSSLHA